MESELIRKRLQGIGFTVTNLQLITDTYGVNVHTSNVLKMQKGLKEIIENKTLDEDVAELVKDMFDALSDGINFYKNKHQRKTLPSYFNIFHLIEELQPDRITFFKEMLRSDEPTKKKTKAELILEEREKLKMQMKIDLLSK